MALGKWDFSLLKKFKFQLELSVVKNPLILNSDFQASPNVKNINEFSKSQSFRTKMKRLEYKLDRKKSKYMR